MTEKIDAKHIIRKLYTKFARKNKVVSHNTYFGAFESDFIFMTNSGYITEIEVKVSKADFIKDFDKIKRIYNRDETQLDVRDDYFSRFTEWPRHDYLREGKSGYKYFYFAMPEDLAEKMLNENKLIPWHAGVISVDHYPRIIKKAPKLPHARKFDQNDVINMMESNYWRTVNDMING